MVTPTIVTVSIDVATPGVVVAAFTTSLPIIRTLIRGQDIADQPTNLRGQYKPEANITPLDADAIAMNRLFGSDLRGHLEDLTKKQDLDISLREEILTMVGMGFQWFGLRQADYSKKCGCVRTEGLEAPKKSCKRCLNTGYLFTDYFVKGYMWQAVLGVEFGASAGLISTQTRNLVVEHDHPVNKFDYILELDQDPDTGGIRQPLSILRTFKVQDVMPMRGKDGRFEFWKCSVEERNADEGRPNEEGTGFDYGGNRSNL